MAEQQKPVSKQPEPASERTQIELAYLHEAISIPEFSLGVESTLGGAKTSKRLKMYLSANGIDITDDNTTWTVPMQNVKVYKLK